MNVDLLLWSRVVKSDGCWEWQGATLPKGYGYFYDGGRMYYVHRLSRELAAGPIPSGLCVRHSCDNPKCVRPEHLLVGTQKDNMDDMAARGRRRTSRRSHAVILAIREAHAAGKSQSAIVAEFGIPRTTIRHIIQKNTWRHVA